MKRQTKDQQIAALAADAEYLREISLQALTERDDARAVIAAVAGVTDATLAFNVVRGLCRVAQACGNADLALPEYIAALGDRLAAARERDEMIQRVGAAYSIKETHPADILAALETLAERRGI